MSGAVGQASQEQAGHRGVLDPSIGPTPLPAALEAALPAEGQGLPRAWLAVALSHKSWLYERASPDGPNGTLTGALGQLGNDVLSVELLACLQQAEPQAGLARRHRVLAQRARVLDALGTSWNLTRHARLGAGEAAQAAAAIGDGRAPSAFGAVATQCLGWWSLFGDERQLREQIGACLRALDQDDAHSQVDAKTLLQEVFAKHGPAFAYQAAGPDHARVFTAVATLRDGRRGRGQGTSKKSAGKAAALDLLLRYAPERLQAPPASEVRARADEAVRKVGRQDAESYRGLAGAFGCSRPENFAVALTHRSWTYERFRDVDLDAGSNTLLAHAGRHAFDLVLNRLRVLRMLGSTVTPTPDQARLNSVPDVEMAPLLDVLDVSHLVRLGAGQRQQGFPTEMKANYVQAVFGAAMLEHRYVRRLEPAVPAAIVARLHDLADSVQFAPSTRLQEELAALGVAVQEVSSVAFGPDHARHFEATVALVSDAETVELEGEGTTKRQARARAAERALAAVDFLNGDAPLAAPGEDAVAGLLLRAQVRALDQTQHWGKWLATGRLGSGYLARGDRDGFRGWQRAAAAALGSTAGAFRQHEPLHRFWNLARDAEPRPLFAESLGALTADLEVLAVSDPVVGDVLARAREALRALSAAHAVRLTSGPRQPIRQLVDDWRLLHARALSVTVAGRSGGDIGPDTAAAVARLLAEASGRLRRAPAGTEADVAVDQAGRGVELGLSVPGRLVGLGGDRVAALICETAPDVKILATDDSVLRLRIEDDTDGWGLAGGRDAQDAFYEQELARLLHDLKNQLSAVSLAVAQRPATRTERLSAELAVSQHLDTVAALTARLRFARLDLDAGDLVGVTELDLYMREYCRELLRTLPATIHLVTPRDTTGARVALSGPALTAILDNLVKNAREAMPAGGTVTIDAVASEDAAIVEVADTGPGVSAAVLQQLAAHEVPASTKRDGSGLGLLSVQRLLRRVGGSLHWSVGTAGGHTWQLILPTAEQP